MATPSYMQKDGFFLADDTRRGISGGLNIEADYDRAANFRSILADQISAGVSAVINMSDIIAGGCYQFGAGTEATVPCISFAADTNTGWGYDVSNANVWAGFNGTLVWDWNGTRIAYSIRVDLEDGTAASPGLRFKDDTDNGLYRIGGDNPAAAAGGVLVFDWNATRANFSKPVYLDDGSVGTPSIVFESDIDTGMYYIGDANLGWSAAGVLIYDYNGTRTNFSKPVYLDDGTVSAPALVFESDTDTGLYYIGDANVGFAVAGTKYIDIQTTYTWMGDGTETGSLRLGKDETPTGVTPHLAIAAGSGSRALYIKKQSEDSAESIVVLNASDTEVFAVEGDDDTNGGSRVISLATNGAQYRASYDGSNFYDIQVNSTGLATFDPAGTSPSTKFQDGLIFQTDRVTADTTLTTEHYNVYCDTDSKAITITLPAGVDGREYRIANVGSKERAVTIKPNGTEKILGENSDLCIWDGDVLIITFETTEGWW